MKLIKNNVDLIKQGPGLEGVYKQIEQASRTCYKSEDKITEDSAKDFVRRMISSGHLSMLEHGTVYLLVPFETHTTKYRNNEYSKVVDIAKDTMNDNSAVTTNMRVIVENNWLDDLKYLCEPTEYHIKRYTMKFTIDRGVSHEFVRHRVFSFAQESTRYCNYSKDKFNNELTFIIPKWVNIEEGTHNTVSALLDIQSTEETLWYESCYMSEWNYKKLLELQSTPQEARAVLNNSLKTELVMTGYLKDWKHFFDLRLHGTTGKPHPDAQYAAALAYKKFVDNDIIPNMEQIQMLCDSIINKNE